MRALLKCCKEGRKQSVDFWCCWHTHSVRMLSQEPLSCEEWHFNTLTPTNSCHVALFQRIAGASPRLVLNLARVQHSAPFSVFDLKTPSTFDPGRFTFGSNYNTQFDVPVFKAAMNMSVNLLYIVHQRCQISNPIFLPQRSWNLGKAPLPVQPLCGARVQIFRNDGGVWICL